MLVAGINAPEVLKGDAVARGIDVFKSSQNVKIGLSIDQIVNVDQQSENFTIVGEFKSDHYQFLLCCVGSVYQCVPEKA